MISQLREIDDDTATVEGPKFDLAKVTETALGILRALVGRSGMQFPDADPPTFSFPFDDVTYPFGDTAYEEIAAVFDQCKRTQYDVTLFSCEVQFGPFMADLYLLGFDCLHGSVANCLTDYDLNWDQLDPTPVMMVMMRFGMIDPIRGAYAGFLMKTLDSFKARGIVWESYDNDGDDLAYLVRFPHEAFGEGVGNLRVCRYLHHVRRDGERKP